ncbi:MAG TPA: TonB-dependent receptor [Steroidobacteraceae bacterium]|nr:TonB-dependent receptor [Steroidobacteraceae bacterium]
MNRNLTDGRAQGVEGLVTFSPLPYWWLTASYSYLDLSLDPHGLDLNRRKSLEAATPRHQFGLRSFHDLPAGLQLDAQLRDLAAIKTLPDIVSSDGIPGYTELDVRLGWRGWKETEVSLAGQNLLHPHHAEFGAPAARGEIARGIFGKIAWNY